MRSTRTGHAVVPPAGYITCRRASKAQAVGMVGHMHLPEPRGPLSEALASDLTTRTALSRLTLEHADRAASVPACTLTDEDLQLALAVCYELHYRGFTDVPDAWEWDPALIRLRGALERRHLAALRHLVGEIPVTAEPIDRQLTALVAADDGPSLSSYMAKQGTLEQWRGEPTPRAGEPPQGGGPPTLPHPPPSRRAEAA